MKIVLFEPQIPQNAGNIARTCAATGSDLILVRPLGFTTANRYLKRAGLDYWEHLKVQEIDRLDEWLYESSCPFFFFSSKATTSYTQTSYPLNSILIFGSETTGLPELYHTLWPERFYRIPMLQNRRCLNLSNAAAIVLYEALRQVDFAFLANQSQPSILS